MPAQPGSKALPLGHPRLVRRVAGIQPDQIHVTYWKEDEVTVSWVTGEPQMGPKVCSAPLLCGESVFVPTHFHPPYP